MMPGSATCGEPAVTETRARPGACRAGDPPRSSEFLAAAARRVRRRRRPVDGRTDALPAGLAARLPNLAPGTGQKPGAGRRASPRRHARPDRPVALAGSGRLPALLGRLGAASALADRSDFGSDAPHPHRPWWLVPTGYCACLCCAAPMSSPRRVGSVGRSASCVLPAPVLRPPSLHSPALLASSIPRPYHGARRTNANPSTCACTVQRPIYIRLSRPTYKSRDRSHACMP